MKKLNGELFLRDHILLFLIAGITLVLPTLLFQPRKNLAVPKATRKPTVILADAKTYDPPGLKEQLYYHDPRVFLEGDDAHSFAAFRVREYNPEYLQDRIGGVPPLIQAPNLQDQHRNDKMTPISSPLFHPMTLQTQVKQTPGKAYSYPLLFNADGSPLPDCRIAVNKNASMPALPTKLRISIPQLDAIPGFIYAELHSSCGNRRLDQLAQKVINQYLLANQKRTWQDGGVLTVYWQQALKPAAIPEDSQKGDRS